MEPELTRTFDLWLGAMGWKLGVRLPSIREYEEASAMLANKIDRWEVDSATTDDFLSRLGGAGS